MYLRLIYIENAILVLLPQVFILKWTQNAVPLHLLLFANVRILCLARITASLIAGFSVNPVMWYRFSATSYHAAIISSLMQGKVSAFVINRSIPQK